MPRKCTISAPKALAGASSVGSDEIQLRLQAIRHGLSQSWILFRQVADGAEDPNFAYDFARLYLNVYIRYQVLQGLLALGLTSNAHSTLEDLLSTLRGLRVKTLVKVIAIQPGSVPLVNLNSKEGPQRA